MALGCTLGSVVAATMSNAALGGDNRVCMGIDWLAGADAAATDGDTSLFDDVSDVSITTF